MNIDNIKKEFPIFDEKIPFIKADEYSPFRLQLTSFLK